MKVVFTRQEIVARREQVLKLMFARCFLWPIFWKLTPVSLIFAGVSLLLIIEEPLNGSWRQFGIFGMLFVLWSVAGLAFSRHDWLKTLRKNLLAQLPDQPEIEVASSEATADGILETVGGKTTLWPYERFHGVLVGRKVLLVLGKQCQHAFFYQDCPENFRSLRTLLRQRIPLWKTCRWRMPNAQKLYLAEKLSSD